MARTKVLVIAAVALALLTMVVATRRHYSTLRSRAESGILFAPDFTLKQLNGTPLRLSDYRGKVVLLDFWATWCAPCRDEIPRFVEWQTKYGNEGLQVIGVSMDDDLEPVQNFSREFKMNYPVAVWNPGAGIPVRGNSWTPRQYRDRARRKNSIEASWTGRSFSSGAGTDSSSPIKKTAR